jgi:hypothetical protein
MGEMAEILNDQDPGEEYDGEEYFWVSKDKRRTLIEEMTTSHLQNIIAFLDRRGMASLVNVRYGRSTDKVEMAESEMSRFDDLTVARYLNMVEELKERKKEDEERKKHNAAGSKATGS